MNKKELEAIIKEIKNINKFSEFIEIHKKLDEKYFDLISWKINYINKAYLNEYITDEINRIGYKWLNLIIEGINFNLDSEYFIINEFGYIKEIEIKYIKNLAIEILKEFI